MLLAYFWNCRKVVLKGFVIYEVVKGVVCGVNQGLTNLQLLICIYYTDSYISNSYRSNMKD